jgi:DNA-binding response OmpR family regulator
MSVTEPSDALTVMIVDDDDLIRNVVGIYFGNKGYRVISAVSGQDCLDKMRAGEPDAVLLDVTMPYMAGWEVCRRIRAFSAVPIIMLTARAQESDKEMGMAMGASDYVTKPVSLKDLEARIRALVHRSSSPAAPGAHRA